MNISMWEWPQYVYLSFMLMALVVYVCAHAMKEDNWDKIVGIVGCFLSSALGFWILYMGGFWS